MDCLVLAVSLGLIITSGVQVSLEAEVNPWSMLGGSVYEGGFEEITDKESIGVCVGGFSGTDLFMQLVKYLTAVSPSVLRLSVTLLYLTADRNANKQISHIAIRHIWILSAPDRFRCSALCI